MPNAAPTRSPPYIALTTFEKFVSDCARHGIPGTVDQSVLQDFSETVRRQIITGLKFLGLIETDGRTRRELKGLVNAQGKDHWPVALEAVLRQAYGPIFALPLHEISAQQFQKSFIEHYPAKQNVTRKCMTFFINAAKSAGIPLSTYMLRGQKPRRPVLATTHTTPIPTANRIKNTALGSQAAYDSLPTPNGITDSVNSESDQAINPTRASQVGFLNALLNQELMTPPEQDAIWTLIKYVNRRGRETRTLKGA